MSNSLLNISMITREALMVLKTKMAFTSAVNRQYDSQFAKSGAKIGATANIRKPPKFTIRQGAALQLQNIEDSSVAVTIDKQRGVDFQFGSAELALNIDDFRKRYLETAMATIAAEIDKDGLSLYTDIWNCVGTPGTAPTDMTYALSAKQRLTESGCPLDMRTMVTAPATNGGMVKANLSLFHAGKEIEKQYLNGSMGRAIGFDWKEDACVATHTCGAPAGAPAVDTTVTANGTATLHLDGITGSITDCYKKGDVLTIQNVYDVHPQTKQTLSNLKQFVVTADTASVSNEIAALPISPAIYASGANQNVSAFPADGALVYMYGAALTYASKVSPANLAFHRDAFALAMVDLPRPGGTDMAEVARDAESGLSVRIVRAYDINNDVWPCRIDVLYGWKTIYSELACRLQG